MALKLRLRDIRPHAYQNKDPQINCEIEAFDDATGRVIDRGNLVYSGDALAAMTQGQIATRLQTDALAWAAEKKAEFAGNADYAKNVATMAKVSALIGAEIVIQ